MKELRVTDEQVREILEVYGGIAEDVGVSMETRVMSLGIYEACLRAMVAVDFAPMEPRSRIARAQARRTGKRPAMTRAEWGRG